jgi:hypothetical protein
MVIPFFGVWLYGSRWTREDWVTKSTLGYRATMGKAVTLYIFGLIGVLAAAFFVDYHYNVALCVPPVLFSVVWSLGLEFDERLTSVR